MISAEDGTTIWTLPLPKFMSTMTCNAFGEHILVFNAGRHLWVNATTGKIDKEVSIVGESMTRLGEAARGDGDRLTDLGLDRFVLPHLVDQFGESLAVDHGGVEPSLRLHLIK